MEKYSFKNKKVANIVDVAKSAKVSIATVSNVVNNTRFVSQGTKENVLKAIKELKYYPSEYARNLAQGKTNTIGLLVSDITNPIFTEFIIKIEEFVAKNNYELIIGNTNYNEKRNISLVKKFIERKICGLIFFTSEIIFELLDDLRLNNIPVVLFDWGIRDRLVSNIKENFSSGIDEAIQHLINLGHRKILYISGPTNLKSVDIRRTYLNSIIKKYIKIKKLDYFSILESNLNIKGGIIAIKRAFELKKEFTAVMTTNDLMAIGAITEMKRRGIKIPDEVSVIGMDNIYLSKIIEPPLTSINIPRKEISQIAWNLLFEMMNNKKLEGREVSVETKLILRKSTMKI